MRIAIIHYHMYPGGVTRIIEDQITALHSFDKDYALSVHAGDVRSDEHIKGLHASVHVEKTFQYLPERITNKQISSSFQKIKFQLEKIAGENEILHLHNVNLGKNPLLTLAAYQLAKRGIKIINHCHDFAEDRPGNYAFLKRIIQDNFTEDLTGVLYPQFLNYHYIVLTAHAFERLTAYEINPVRISLLPNPVSFAIETSGRISRDTVTDKLNLEPIGKICLYPVRAIRRKNIGEFILLSVLFRNRASWLITQPPRNPVEIPEYLRWKKFCRLNGVPVVFEAGEMIDIHDLMPASDFCVTTSIMEGFGLAFLEPWLAGIPVIGRNIEFCTTDLKRNGIQFPLLYDRFIVTFNGEKTDFSDLEQKHQQRIIKDVLLRPDKGKEIIACNPFLCGFLNPVGQDLIRNNQQVIRERYSLERYGQQLHGIYKKLSGTT
ncbi:MAG: glycosyltransferase family 4 protein [Bacteroidales bacterium]|nr:glycosyltransferase family 4 protein [Bacteroidales bacterium]